MLASTKSGGLKARDKNLAKDPDFYKKIGARGGKATKVPKGFAANKELASVAGRKGGGFDKKKTMETVKAKYGDDFYIKLAARMREARKKKVEG